MIHAIRTAIIFGSMLAAPSLAWYAEKKNPPRKEEGIEP